VSTKKPIDQRATAVAGFAPGCRWPSLKPAEGEGVATAAWRRDLKRSATNGGRPQASYWMML
jgi:hypothetical protein